MSLRRAERDDRLSARITRRWPLLHTDGADAALDRAAHVRAGSALVRVGPWLVVVQDDASFLAVVAPDGGRVGSVTLPAGPGGRRQFDKHRGNKMDKLDLESAVPLGEDGLLAFGSGSAAGRDRILRLRGLGSTSPEVELIDAGPLYAALAGLQAFSGSEMNIEGAVVLGETLRLFNRGNGAPRGALLPMDASVDLSWPGLLAWLEDPSGPPPALRDPVAYDLNRLNNARLTFTDVTRCASGVLFLAAAEDSPDAVADGPVAGVVVGLIDEAGVRWCPLLGPDGEAMTDKAEGISLDPTNPRRAFVVFDLDDPEVPTEMAEVLLDGPWGQAPRRGQSPPA